MSKRVLICGSRTIDHYESVANAIAKGLAGLGIETPLEIITGGGKGVDSHAETWAKSNGIATRVNEANWRLGKGAGLVHNKKLAEYADVLIAVYDGESKGTQNAIDLFKEHRKPYYIAWVKVADLPKAAPKPEMKLRKQQPPEQEEVVVDLELDPAVEPRANQELRLALARAMAERTHKPVTRSHVDCLEVLYGQKQEGTTEQKIQAVMDEITWD